MNHEELERAIEDFGFSRLNPLKASLCETRIAASIPTEEYEMSVRGLKRYTTARGSRLTAADIQVGGGITIGMGERLKKTRLRKVLRELEQEGKRVPETLRVTFRFFNVAKRITVSEGYHLTLKEHIPEIMRNGLTPRIPRGGVVSPIYGPKAVYIVTDPGDFRALKADLAFIDHPEWKDEQWVILDLINLENFPFFMDCEFGSGDKYLYTTRRIPPENISSWKEI